MKPLYTIQELAAALHLEPSTVRNKLSRGDDMPPSIQIGRRRLFPQEQFEAWLRAHAIAKAAAHTVEEPEVQSSSRLGRPRRSQSA